MDWINQLSNQLEGNTGLTLLVLAAVSALLFLVCLLQGFSIRSLKRKYRFLLQTDDSFNLGTVFTEMDYRVDRLEDELKESAGLLNRLVSGLQGCVQKVGLIRFDAFDDVGGQQSYALAMMDANNNGVVISSLYSRVDNRTYAKPLQGGRSQHTLSEEEQKAVEMALETGKRQG